jgi:hypothetical protein
MKIYRFFFTLLLISQFANINAQDGSLSPYSFFGLGDKVFKGTVENIAMGNILVYTDSIHYNIQNPSSLAALKFVSLNLGVKNDFTHFADNNNQLWGSTHNISYFSLAIPIGKKFGAGFGLLPENASDYKIYQKNDLGTYTFDGTGGNNRFFLATAYQINKYFSVGLEYQYYFGNLKHENLWVPDNVITYTKENNVVSFKGSTFKFSTSFQYYLNDKNYFNLQGNYKIGNDLEAEYRYISRLLTTVSGTEEVVEVLDETQKQGTIKIPETFDVGVGYGEKNKWFFGVQYAFSGQKDFRNPFYDPSYVQYKDASTISMGGLYTPQHNSITKYWKRITYKFGGYYNQTGMNYFGEDINDFGITFGVSLPSLKGISNLNLGVMMGKRGKVSQQLVEEKYINLHISLSLNDKWFNKRKIN